MPLHTMEVAFTQVSDLAPLKGMLLEGLAFHGTPVSDLSPLQGMPLTYLLCSTTSISDLTPLKGMQLSVLGCDATPVSDLSPIKDMPLQHLALDFKPERDSDILRSIKTLETINGKPAAEFWKEVDAHQAAFDDWTKKVAALPAEEQVKAVVKKLQELNPGFDGKETHQIEAGEVAQLAFFTDNVTDISPVRALSGLKTLECRGVQWSTGALVDISPLQGMQMTELRLSLNGRMSDLTPLMGMPLTALHCDGTSVADLAPLKGMKLTTLGLRHTSVADLSPLAGMPLTFLDCVDVREVADLSPLAGMKLTNLGINSSRITDLSPLRGMPLEDFQVLETPIADLSPLAGMPLKLVHIVRCPNVSDLSPLKGSPLKHLVCDFKPFRDTDLLRSIKTLETINLKPAAEFWQEVEAQQAAFDAWMKQVAGMPAEEQVQAVVQKLQELNPGFDGKETHGIVNGVVTKLEFVTDNVTDISPVRGLAGLLYLACSGSAIGKGKLADLSPIKGMQLTFLACNGTQVADLAPLKGMPLINLNCFATQVSDLSPLEGMPLSVLTCSVTKVADLSPLKGMPLTELGCYYTQVSDLSPLTGMPLTYLGCHGTKVSDLSPLKGMFLRTLFCAETEVSDLSPIKDMPLKEVFCDFKPERDSDILRSIKTLETINGKPAEEFWKEVEGNP